MYSRPQPSPDFGTEELMLDLASPLSLPRQSPRILAGSEENYRALLQARRRDGLLPAVLFDGFEISTTLKPQARDRFRSGSRGAAPRTASSNRSQRRTPPIPSASSIARWVARDPLSR